MKTDYNKVIADNSKLETDINNLLDKVEAQKEEQAQQTDTKRILKVQWLNQTVTNDMFTAIGSSIDELENRARQLAYTYNVEQKYLEIINLLVRAQELRNLRNTYGK